ncbi:hypothetical protein HK105_208473 [Polyrhizophydium stewartii]|uniref:Uncharacterized protein n=1 Tax=Polyrhizophydium stewartii TaxID=2732419 RepID=A0ABR4MXR1_9FUNG|nr:hypothetical protein HK105_005123 [Polyrhizophydium stewartii]
MLSTGLFRKSRVRALALAVALLVGLWLLLAPQMLRADRPDPAHASGMDGLSGGATEPPAVQRAAPNPAAVPASAAQQQRDSMVADFLRRERLERAAGKLAGADFVGLTRRVALHRDMLLAMHPGLSGLAGATGNGTSASGSSGNDADLPELELPLDDLEALAYPWLRAGQKFRTIRELASSFKGRGIVMTSGTWHFKFARHAASVVRELGSKLPIELFYVGDNDLPADYRAELEKIPNLRTIDLKPFMDTQGPDISGWGVKPFSMLFSSFRHMIFLDADALFFQPPEVLFDSKGYRDTGAVLFMDRTLYPDMDSNGLKFFNTMVANPSDYARTVGRLLRKLSIHEGESGVIVWDKLRNLHPLLLTCLMNSQPHREVLYKAYHGDKESYWIAHEALAMPYRWAPGAGGTIGFIKGKTGDDAKKVCGGLYHPDENWRPLWFNGGILRNKYTDKGQTSLEMTHWATDRTFRNARWDWETQDTPFCLLPNDPANEFGVMTAAERETAAMLVRVWERLDGTSAAEKKKKEEQEAAEKKKKKEEQQAADKKKKDEEAAAKKQQADEAKAKADKARVDAETAKADAEKAKADADKAAADADKAAAGKP